jgi:hypothetical protein
MGDRHTPYLNIEEDMKFTIVLIIKKKTRGNLYCLKLS